MNGHLVIAAVLAAEVLTGVAFGFVLPEVRADAVREELVAEFQSRSYPPDLERVSMVNPWGEAVEILEEQPADFALRVVAAAEMYAEQGIRFDGYIGSDGDGSHYTCAADGEDGAYYAVPSEGRFVRVRDGLADDPGERVWVCADLVLHALTMAGFPIRQALWKDHERATYTYTLGGAFMENGPETLHFFRRIRNLQLYFERNQFYSEQRITKAQYRNPAFVPEEAFRPGDVVFFGHYGDRDGLGPWHAKHAGIVATVDGRGLPVRIYNMRVSEGLVDRYDGELDQTRTIAGERVHFERFSDRYSLIGFGRVTQWPAAGEGFGSEPVTAE